MLAVRTWLTLTSHIYLPNEKKKKNRARGNRRGPQPRFFLDLCASRLKGGRDTGDSACMWAWEMGRKPGGGGEARKKIGAITPPSSREELFSFFSSLSRSCHLHRPRAMYIPLRCLPARRFLLVAIVRVTLHRLGSSIPEPLPWHTMRSLCHVAISADLDQMAIFDRFRTDAGNISSHRVPHLVELVQVVDQGPEVARTAGGRSLLGRLRFRPSGHGVGFAM